LEIRRFQNIDQRFLIDHRFFLLSQREGPGDHRGTTASAIMAAQTIFRGLP
jgi:hypothetical protein